MYNYKYIYIYKYNKKKHTWGSRCVSSPSRCSSQALSSSHCPSVEVRGCGGGHGDMYGGVKIPGFETHLRLKP